MLGPADQHVEPIINGEKPQLPLRVVAHRRDDHESGLLALKVIHGAQHHRFLELLPLRLDICHTLLLQIVHVLFA